MKAFWIVLATVAITLASVAGGIAAYQHVLNKGMELGIDAYHKQCSSGGGFIVHKGYVVACKGMGKVPEGDVLDKLEKM